MKEQSTNKRSIERSRESVNALLRRPGTDPLLVEILSDLLWVVDHQQDQLEQMYAWTKYTIEQALVDHAHGDGTVRINETCVDAIKAWYHTDGVMSNSDASPDANRRAPKGADTLYFRDPNLERKAQEKRAKGK